MGKRRKQNRGISFLYYTMITIWLFLVSATGFFFPYVIDSLPYFKIRNLEVEGAVVIPVELVAKAVSEVKNNWLFLYTHKGKVLESLREATGDAVEDVKIEPKFSLKGVDVKLTVIEREPLIKVVVDEKVFFLDEKGYEFSSLYHTSDYPIAYTSDEQLLKDNFKTLVKLVKMFEESNINSINLYITDINTIVYIDNYLRITIPPIFSINDEILIKLREIYKIQDVKEVNIISEGVAIIK